MTEQGDDKSSLNACRGRNNRRLSDFGQVNSTGPSRRERKIRIIKATVGSCIFILGSFCSLNSRASEFDNTQSDDKPLVSMAAILERRARSVSSLHWYDSERLIGQFNDPRTGKSAIRVISMSGALGEPLQHGEYPSISPDGRLLILHADDGWLIRDILSGTDAYLDDAVTEHLVFSPTSSPVWSSNGRYAALLEHYRGTGAQGELKPPIGTDVPVIDVAEQVPPLKQRGSRITIFDRKTPHHQQRILLNELAVELAWGSSNALYVSKSNFFSGDAWTAVVRIQPGSQEVEEVYRTPGRFQDMLPAIQPNGDMMALVFDVDNRTWDDFQSLLLINLSTGRELRRVTQNIPLLGHDYVWSPRGDEIYARVRHGGLDQIYVIPLRGKPRPLTEGLRRHYDLSLSPDGQRLAYQTEDGYGHKDIRILNILTHEEKVVLVLDNPSEDFDLGEWRHIRWDSTDGVRPFGFLFLPPNFDSGTKYPLLVDVHGGGDGSRLYLSAPLTITVAPGPLEWHAWAALGYVVFVPDYRSTGDYGPEVIRARYEAGVSAAVKDIEDIVSGTRFVMRRGSVDPTRVAILGHSAGGKRVYLLLTRYDLYAAAILNEATAPDPVSLVVRLVSGINTGSYPEAVFQHIFGGDLADFPERYKVNYMFDSYRVKTPTLIMVGNEALGGVMHMPNEVLYSMLRKNGVPAKMLRFTNEGHTYSSPAAAKYAFNQARIWLDIHLENR